MQKNSGKLVLYLLISLLVAIADLATKKIVRLLLKEKGVFKVINGLVSLVIVENKGIAFGFLRSGIPTWLITSVTLILSLVVFLVLLKCAKKESFLPNFSLSLILGGSWGNLTERVLKGYVTDFLDLHYRGYHWPCFNMADISITIGVALLVFSSIKRKKEKGGSNPPSSLLQNKPQ